MCYHVDCRYLIKVFASKEFGGYHVIQFCQRDIRGSLLKPFVKDLPPAKEREA